jgi:hypothetical protein
MHVFRHFPLVETTRGSMIGFVQFGGGLIPISRKDYTFSFGIKKLGVHSVQMPAGLKICNTTPIKNMCGANLSEIRPTSELLHALDEISI